MAAILSIPSVPVIFFTSPNHDLEVVLVPYLLKVDINRLVLAEKSSNLTATPAFNTVIPVDILHEIQGI